MSSIYPHDPEHTAGWATLPAELIHVIGQRVSTLAYDQFIFELNELQLPGEVNAQLRAHFAARQLARLGLVCKAWKEAIRLAPFWETLFHFTFTRKGTQWYNELRQELQAQFPLDDRITGEQYFEAKSRVCIQCLLWYPQMGTIALSYNPIQNPYTGTSFFCKLHHNKLVCSHCFRDERIFANYNPPRYESICVVDDTDECFPGAEYTCEPCRVVAIRRWTQYHRITDRDIHTTDSFDNIQSYRIAGEGSMEFIAQDIIERRWLLATTKIKDVSAQASAAARFTDGLGVKEAMETESGSILFWEPSVRQLALRDFIRRQIISGTWMSPDDIWGCLYGQHAEDPTYWDRRKPVQHYGRQPFATDEDRPINWWYMLPPTSLHTTLVTVWLEEMENLLEPVLKNIVRSIDDRCLVDKAVYDYEHADAKDSLSAAHSTVEVLKKMRLVDVWDMMIQQECWVTGYDWKTSVLNEYKQKRRLSNASHDSERSKSSTTSAFSNRLTDSPTDTCSTPLTTPSPSPPLNAFSTKVPPVSSPTDAPAPPDSHLSYRGSSSPSAVNDASKTGTAQDLPTIEPTAVHAYIPSNLPIIPRIECVGEKTLQHVWLLWNKMIKPLVQCQCNVCRRQYDFDESLRLLKATGIRIPQFSGTEESNDGHSEMDTRRTLSPNLRKRNSEELESRPSTPAKRRKLSTASPVGIAISQTEGSEAAGSPPSTVPSSDAAPDSQQTANETVAIANTGQGGQGLEAITGIHAPEGSVGLSFADFVFEEDLDDEEYEDEDEVLDYDEEEDELYLEDEAPRGRGRNPQNHAQ